MKNLMTLLWLTVVWVTLWEVASWANVIGGVVVAVAVVALLPPRDSVMRTGLRPIAAIRMSAYFFWELVKASAFMAWEVVTPRIWINAAIVSVRLTTTVPGIVVAVANMVSLVPGTVTLEVDEDTSTLFIHVLHLKSIEETRESVHTLERLTLAAFPPQEGSAALAEQGGAS